MEEVPMCLWSPSPSNPGEEEEGAATIFFFMYQLIPGLITSFGRKLCFTFT